MEGVVCDVNCCGIAEIWSGMPVLSFLRVSWFCAGAFIDGKPIVNLPPRIVNLQQSEFSLEERSFYSNLEADSRAQFQVSDESYHRFGRLGGWSLMCGGSL